MLFHQFSGIFHHKQIPADQQSIKLHLGRKFAEGYPIAPAVNENGEERVYIEVQFTPQFWFSGDLKWLSELAGDLGAGSNYPSSILKNVHASMFSYANSIVVHGGQGNDSFPLPQ